MDILNHVKPDKDWMIYHEGIDNFYQRAGYPKDKILQGKGTLFKWQCRSCNILERVESNSIVIFSSLFRLLV